MTTDPENGGPSGTSPNAFDQRPTVPPRNQKRRQSNCPPPLIFDGMEHVPDSDTPELPNQPPARELHDQCDLEMGLIRQGEDRTHCIVLKVKAQLICELSQELKKEVENLRPEQEEGSETNNTARLSIQAKNPEVLAAVIYVVHKANPDWRINCFEDFVVLATTCRDFGCRIDRLDPLLSERPTWSLNDPDEDQDRIGKWIFAALVFKYPEIFQQATHKMVMDFKSVPKDSEHAELLPVDLRRKIRQKGHEILEEILVFVRTCVIECLEQEDPAGAGAFMAAIHNCLKGVGYHLFNSAADQGRNQGATHLLKALENLPLQPPTTSIGTIEIGLCVPDQAPDSPTAASHHSGSSNSSSLPTHTKAIPPRRARAALVIANAVADLWDKRVAFAGEIRALVSGGFGGKSNLKDINQEKYVELVRSFQEKLEEEKVNWSFKGFELRHFQTSTDNPQRPPEVGAAEGNGEHSHE